MAQVFRRRSILLGRFKEHTLNYFAKAFMVLRSATFARKGAPLLTVRLVAYGNSILRSNNYRSGCESW